MLPPWKYLIIFLLMQPCFGELKICGQTSNQYYHKYFEKINLEFEPITCRYKLDCKGDLNFVDYLPKSEELLKKNESLQLELFKLIGCTLPNEMTVKELMTKLNIKTTEQIVFEESNLTDISGNIFSGLKNLSTLVIKWNYSNRLPSNLIYDNENLKNFDISENRVEIPEELFKRSRNLKILRISGNSFPKNTTGMFQGLKNLTTLEMFQMSIKQIEENLFNDLVQLRVLELSVNEIETLPKNVFKNLINLKQLSLRRNNISELSEDVFINNKMLTILRLNECFTPNFTIPEKIFRNSVNLEQLDLSYNFLHSLPKDLFNNLKSLKELHLNKNKLTSLPITIFSNLEKLNKLDISGNQIIITNEIFHGLQSLKILNLSNNSLITIDPTTFNYILQLEELDLSNNQLDLLNNSIFDEFGMYSPIRNLQKLYKLTLNRNRIKDIFFDWKTILLELEEIDLSYNNFTILQDNDFNFLQNRIEINLHHNQIQKLDINHVEQNILNKLTSIKNIHINIDNNPFHCSCNLYDIYRYFNRKIHSDVQRHLTLQGDDVKCSTPDKLYGRSITDIKPEDFTCDLKDEGVINAYCPIGATCSFKPITKTLIIDESYKKLNNIREINNITTISDYFRVNKQDLNIVMNVTGNEITRLNEQFNGYENVNVLDLSNNGLTGIEWLPEKLQYLYLHNNEISNLNATEIGIINSTNYTNITLYDNPWECNCEAMDFLKYLQENYRRIIKPSSIKCANTDNNFLDLTIEDLCPSHNQIVIYASVSLSIICLLIAVLIALFYRYNMEIKVWLYAHQTFLWFVTEEELDKDKIYDAFISYSHKDEDFIINEILPKLENGPKPYKLCLHFRNWQPGEFITTNISRSIIESRRTIVIVSTNFIQSEWGKMEFKTAHVQALSEGRARVIVVLYGEVPMDNLDDELKAYLNTNTYVKWGDPWFWDKLKYALPHHPKYARQAYPMDVMKTSDKLDLITEANTPPPESTPPIDKINTNPMINGNTNRVFVSD